MRTNLQALIHKKRVQLLVVGVTCVIVVSLASYFLLREPSVNKENYIDDIQIRFSEGLLIDDCYLTNNTGQSLKSVVLTITTTGLRGDTYTSHLFWADWSPGETKKHSTYLWTGTTVIDVCQVDVEGEVGDGRKIKLRLNYGGGIQVPATPGK